MTSNSNIFYKKNLALQFISSTNDPNKKMSDKLHLFSEDISMDNKKRFIVDTYEGMYEKINKIKLNKINNNMNFYENIETNQDVKLHLDIDYKIDTKTNNNNNNNNTLYSTNLDILNDPIKIVNDKLKKDYAIEDPIIIVLSANTEIKISFHIIYTNVVFDDIYKMKGFMTELITSIDTIKDNSKTFIDLSIYRTGCFRMLWSSKINKSNKLIFHKGINYENKNDSNLFYDCLITNINTDYYSIDFTIPENIKKSNNVCDKNIKEQFKLSLSDESDKSNKLDKSNNSNKHNQKKPCEIELNKLQQYMDCIDPIRADNYKQWLDIGICLYNSNNKSFDIWHEWSKKSSSYQSESECLYKWNSFIHGKENIMGIGTLI